jgi:hypothetical protein
MITDQMVEAALDAWWEDRWWRHDREVNDLIKAKRLRAALEAAEAAAPPDPRDAAIAALGAEVERLVKAGRAMTECDLGAVPGEGCTCAACEAWYALRDALEPFNDMTS